MITTLDEMRRQGMDVKPENFLCFNCTNYQGSLVCTKRIFIAFEGANMSVCRFYRLGHHCSYCGKMI